jgi:predicted nucleic acid-binding protein
MDTAVFDASVIARLFIVTPLYPTVRQYVKDTNVLAPDILVAETGNALWKAFRAGAMERPDLQRSLLETLKLADFTPAIELAERAMELAMDMDHPIYDCLYLTLCERRDVPLITADRRLAAKSAEFTNITVINLLDTP